MCDARFDFAFDPLCVGDMSTIGFMEELAENQVNDAVDYIRRTYGEYLTKTEMESVFSMFEIDYFSLPKYLRDKFDEFDIRG